MGKFDDRWGYDRSKNNPDSWYSRNRELSIARSKAWHKNNKERSNKAKRLWAQKNPNRRKPSSKQLAEARWKVYGLNSATYELYTLLNEVQGGVCALCKGHTKGGRKLSWDHNHQTGATRALLCIKCNYRLGHLESMLEDGSLITMLEYLNWWHQAQAFSNKYPLL